LTEEKSQPASRKPRADAERNRQLLIRTAKAAFAEKGSTASLEEIARTANVGIGTLYRHFPTRDALIEAVYRNETEMLIDAAAALARTHSPIEALRAWMLLFIDYMETKQGMYEVLDTLVGGTSDLYAMSGARMTEAINRLVDHAAESGAIRRGMDPLDLLRALAGVMNVSAGPNPRESARQLVDILIAGLRTGDGQGKA
jgi:AcrR family transcriptional regulator